MAAEVHYDFYWQLSYRLAEPLPLKAGTILQAVAWFDNSRHNPHNPDPTKEVRWGDQTSDEMMVGFFDVAVPAGLDKTHYFIRHPAEKYGTRSVVYQALNHTDVAVSREKVPAGAIIAAWMRR